MRTPGASRPTGPPLLLLGALVAAPGLPADAGDAAATLTVGADTSICAHRTERDLNAGGARRLKLKGIENMILLRPDASGLAGRIVVSATLLLEAAAERMMVRRVGVSTVAAPWVEGAGGYAAEPAGGATFHATGAGPWAGGGSTILDAVWGRAGTFWARAEAARRGRAYAVPVDGRFLEACAAGLSDGLLVSDDNGQTMRVHRDVDPDTNYSNNYFRSRESGADGPRFEVRHRPVSRPRPRRLRVRVAPWPAGATFAAGAVEASWPAPRDPSAAAGVLGYRLRLGVNGAEPAPVPRRFVPAPPPPGAEGRVRAMIGGLPPGRPVRVEVEVVSRGGAVAARGRGRGRSGPALARPEPLRAPAVERPAGEPPSAGAAACWAVPDGVKVNPVTGNALEESGVDYSGPPQGGYRRANPAWSAAERTVHLAGLRGEWVAAQLVVERTGKEPVEFAVSPGPLAGPRGAVLPAGSFRLFRCWYQRTGEGPRAWHADPLLPLGAGEAFAVPDPANAVPGQRNQAVYLELFVPPDARPGIYAGPVTVRAGGASCRLDVRLEVGRGRLPARAAFTWSLNAYSSPGHEYGPPLSGPFLEAERAFYAMAHDHRACLAVLHYSHSGRYEAGAAPPVAGRGAAARVEDWTAWDRRFAPLLDGDALRGTSRPGEPLDHFYLALSEHYPTPMADGYRWNDLRWEDHWREAGEIEHGFTRAYRERWEAVARAFADRARRRKWRTRFHVYLNDKYFYKQYDPDRRAWGEGVSFWLLDEPQHIDDFLALRYFGRLLREAQAGDRSTLVYRVDVSAPRWGRGTLDRVADLVVNGDVEEGRRWLEDGKLRHGQSVWTYGAPPPSTRTALSLSALAVHLYARGVDGFVPWLVLGGPDNWREFAPTCVLYSGKVMGVPGPCPSLRLKAMRRAEQDVHYLRLLARARGLDRGDPLRRRLAALVSREFGAAAGVERLDQHGARAAVYDRERPERWAVFRRAVLATAR